MIRSKGLHCETMPDMHKNYLGKLASPDNFCACCLHCSAM